ncbi:MAG: ferritin family protein [Bacillota bacterium]|nr:ferritin family protein [Bacillota bacterium]MDI7248449.1 ferritin family protein [Bacillota bacterium]
MDLINEVKLGVARGTAVEEAVRHNFQGEISEVGLYLAVARQAYREGYPEVGEVLVRIAQEEAWHAAGYAELAGMISESTAGNIKKMLAGEQAANRGKREAAVKAKEAGVDPAHDFFDETSRDEGRHARALQGLLDRYFPSA